MKQKNVILMVVAVGCGLVAAFLTSQMSAKGQVEQVDVVVAAKDLPVGTMITREELKTAVKTKKMPKDGLPPAYITNPEDLVDKRLSRPVRMEETFNPQDLSKGGAITLPEGYDMASLQIGVANAAAGFVGPGSRVNVLATVRLSNKTYAFPLLVNMLVVAVDTQTTYTKEGTFPTMNTVSFAVKEKEALLLSLAKSRGCSLELMLRHPSKSTDADKDYKIEDVIKLLQDEQNKADIKGTGTGDEKKPDPVEVKKPDTVTPPVTPPTTPAEVKKPDRAPPAVSPFAPPPTIPVKKILIAKRDITPHTDVTKDLIAEAFELKEVPKEFAPDALDDLTEVFGKQFKTGVSKGQWVTPFMVGIDPKAPPREDFVPKPGEPPVTPKPADPVKPEVVRRKTHDVAVHGTNGTIVHRYEEVKPGVWKKIAELSPEQAARDAREDKPEAPKAAPKAD